MLEKFVLLWDKLLFVSGCQGMRIVKRHGVVWFVPSYRSCLPPAAAQKLGPKSPFSWGFGPDPMVWVPDTPKTPEIAS
jgi:hypothetical protein